MSRYISMLRGINIGGHKRIKMESLRSLYGKLGFKNIRSYIQSGNVVFESGTANPDKIREKIQTGITAEYGFEVGVVLRSSEEMQSIVDKNPFPAREEVDISKLHVVFLGGSTRKKIKEIISESRAETEEVAAGKKEIYLYLPNGYGRSKLNNNFFEKKLGVSATTRNWKTVNILLEMVR